GGAQYAHASPALHSNIFMSISAWGLLVAQVPFIFNFVWNIIAARFIGHNVDSNPWQATTLEWSAAPTPPLPHKNFAELPVVRRGPYEYSVPGAATDHIGQHEVVSDEPVPMIPQVAVQEA
ncbi:MAG TPA: cytochrome C oxidase subunit I, partial [Thermoanaerobaculia bacterium]|nr:cytochrome C oxidase subunit I [Thermoanaerobaculia bacterium]